MRPLNIALTASCLSVLLGWTFGLNVWNDGWSLDLVDLAVIPLVAWVLYKIWRKR